MPIHQMVASLAFGDAISNEALYMQSLIRARGIESEIFAEFTDSSMSGRARPLAAYQAVSSPNNVLILHFSIGSRTASLAHLLSDKLLLRYHNITPARWFEPYCPKIAMQCLEGRRELAKLAGRTTLALGASEFSRNELRHIGFRRTDVLPLLFDPARLSAVESPVVLEMLDDDRTNILFVGRVMPNKRLEDVMKVFKFYQSLFDRRSRLLFVGQHEDLELYYEQLIAFSDRLQLRHVEFPGHVTTEELVAFYRVADVFVCMSEHEGFGAPLLEAFQMGVPVIAYDAGAVAETLGGAGLLVHRKSFPEIAGLAHLVVNDAGIRERIVSTQHRVLDAALARDPGELLMGFVERMSTSLVPVAQRGMIRYG